LLHDSDMIVFHLRCYLIAALGWCLRQTPKGNLTLLTGAEPARWLGR